MTVDEQALLEVVPTEGTIGGKAARQQLGWEKDRYLESLSGLVGSGRLRVGRGRGGSLERVIGGDAIALLAIIPASGDAITNARAREAVDWEKERYFAARDELLDQGLVDKQRGPGGMVSRVVSREEAEAEAEAEIEAEAEESAAANVEPGKESDLYEPIGDVLRGDWAREARLMRYAVEVIAHQGSARTGGRWSRPDIAVLSLRKFPLTGRRVFDVYTFEVKLAGQWDVTAIYEAAAHGRRATYPFAFLHHEGELGNDEAVLESCMKEARRLGVGLITSPDPRNFDSWDVRVEPERHDPDPEMLEEFLAQQFPRERIEEVRGWWQD